MRGLKLGIITILTIVFVGNVSAQDSKGQWAISAGVNIIDVRGGDDFSSRFNDYLGNSDWNWANSPLSRITAETYLSEALTLQIAGSLNKLDNGFDDVTHSSFDVNVKYGLDAVVSKVFGKSTKYFSSY